MKKESNSVYVAALLHDIGKFLQRADDSLWNERANSSQYLDITGKSYAHRRYSSAFVDWLKENSKFFDNNDLNFELIKDLILYHHQTEKAIESDYTNLIKIIRIADSLASSEKQLYSEEDIEYDEVSTTYKHTLLENILTNVSIGSDNNTKSYFKPLKLDFEKPLMPVDKGFDESLPNDYKELLREFEEDAKRLTNVNQLFYLLKKYTSFIPAQTPFRLSSSDKEYLYKPDVSLFDHLRMVSAIAYCIALEYENGNIDNEFLNNLDLRKLANKENNKNTINKDDKEFAFLLHGDISGIQKFIFNVKSKGATKNLKARSFFLEILMEVLVKYILDETDTPLANVIYLGGGNFYMILPASKRYIIEEIKKEVDKYVLSRFYGEFYVAMGIEGVSFGDFVVKGNNNNPVLRDKWDNVVRNTAISKRRKFASIEYDDIFKPGFRKSEDLHEDFITLFDDIKNAKAITIKRLDGSESKGDFPLQMLGYGVNFKGGSFNNSYSLLINSTDFVGSGYDGFRFGVLNTPKVIRKGKEDFASLDDLIKPEGEDGDDKLGILKMDVDNLGSIFRNGLGNWSLSRVSTLSSLLSMFFTMHIDDIRKRYEKVGKPIYVVYAGGDDSFILGHWKVIIDVARDINDKFSKYTNNNANVHISAGIVMTHYKYPIYQSATYAEEELEIAKRIKLGGEVEPKKNRLTMFGTPIRWAETEDIIDFANTIVDIVKDEGSRGILYKLFKVVPFFESVFQDIKNNKVVLKRVWHLYYSLRDVKKENREKIIANLEEIIKMSLLNSIKNKDAIRINTMAIALKIAEMKTRRRDKK